MTWRPKDWKPLTSSGTTDDERLARVCHCDRCEADGPHEPMCAVHFEPAEPCDCPKKDEKRKDGR